MTFKYLTVLSLGLLLLTSCGQEKKEEVKPEPKETIFNLKNKECQAKFKNETTNNNKLSKIMEEEEDLEIATQKFLKQLNKTLYKCFRKVGLRKEKTNQKLWHQWMILFTDKIQEMN